LTPGTGTDAAIRAHGKQEENTMAKLRTIQSVDEDRALIAVRLIRQGSESGYDASVRRMLGAANLAEYANGRTSVMAISGLDTALADLATRVAQVTLRAGRPVGEAQAAEAFYGVVDSWRTQVYDAIRYRRDGITCAEVPQEAPVFTVEELNERYGMTGAMPRPTGEHAEAILAERHRLVGLFVEIAITDGLCGEFERRITMIGLGKDLPVREHEITAEVPGVGEMTVTVQSEDRRGTIEPWMIGRAFQAAIADKLARDIEAWMNEQGQALKALAKPKTRAEA
jgi:hypothetical protein